MLLLLLFAIKSPVMIYVDFEIILVPKNNRKQNAQESYTNILLWL